MEDLKLLLKQWNSWWVDHTVPETKTKIQRDFYLKKITKLLNTKEIICLSGVRRCGKSTLIYQTIAYLLDNNINPKNIFYFNFDTILETKNPDLFNKVIDAYVQLNNPKGKKYFFFDEIQNVPNWEKHIKSNYDLYEDIKFIISGSNSTMLADKLSTLLTGRMFSINIYPLSFKEYLKFNDFSIKDIDLQKNQIKYHLNNYFHKGGFPEVVLEKDNSINEQRLKEYLNSILLKDIVISKNIRESSKLIDLTVYCLSNISAPLSYNSISKALTININTLKEYMFFLQQAYLMYQINYFSYSVKQSVSIQKPKKIYCIDTALRDATAFKFSSDAGKIAENIVFLELKRKDMQIYYWSDHFEVDFVVKNKNNKLTAVNVTYTNDIPEREIKALNDMRKKHKEIDKCIIITKDIEHIENNVYFIPLWKWLLKNNL